MAPQVYSMTIARLIVVSLVGAALLCGCMSPDDEYDPRIASPFNTDAESPKTPPLERIADLLQNAKQSYDDGAYEFALRFAERAVEIVDEYRLSTKDKALAIVIQGYCLLQLGYVDDYFYEGIGVQHGAISKFKSAKELGTTDFRARLGIGLANFRRHGSHIRKVSTLTKGASTLYDFSFRAVEALNGLSEKGGVQGVRRVLRDITKIIADADRMYDTGYVFRDPSTLSITESADGKQAKLLGNLNVGEGQLLVKDIVFALEDAIQLQVTTAADIKMIEENANRIRDNWLLVRRYWQGRALNDLKSARDSFLSLRKDATDYFWVDRDLTFTYQSIGSFFLEISMDMALNQAISERTKPHEIESRVNKIFISEDFSPWQKGAAKKNYQDALEFNHSFMIRHKKFVEMRITKRDEATFDDETANPFLTSLVKDYHGVMDDLISEEQYMRVKMTLEAASLCIDPQFQINDIPRALGYANKLRAMDARNPIHYFVSATAYFQDKDWQAAKASYEAFMRDSSITEDSAQRNICRKRIMECDSNLRREKGNK